MIKSAYAFCADDKYLKSSASGGAFMAIAEEAFKTHSDCAVYGVMLDSNLSAKHVAAYSLEECGKFQGSKYIASTVADVFEDLRNDITNGKYIVFSGVPCQIFATIQMLHKYGFSCDNVLFVDIMCHGTPKDNIWRDYILWLEEKEKSFVVNYSFRYKPAKWKNYPSMAQFYDGRMVVNSHEVRMFNEMFLSNRIMREACYNCKFACEERCGDVSLADFWGIKNVMPSFPRENGVSLVLINSEKGENVMKKLTENTSYTVKKCTDDSYKAYQHNLKKPTDRPCDTDAFFEDYEKYGFDYCVRKYYSYNFKGKLKFYIKKLLNEAGIVDLIRNR